jgi:uncharacterized protein (TIGR00730 family)
VPAISRLCVFCGSRLGNRPTYADAAERFGRLLAEEGIGMVYGGASVGLMGVVADAARSAGGDVIGVIPTHLVALEIAHTGLSDLRVVGSLAERKAVMAELSDAFVALPGGFGTLEELFEMVTATQIGVHDKPTGLLDVDGYFHDLLAFLDHSTAEGLLNPDNRRIVMSDADPERLLDALRNWSPRTTESAASRDQLGRAGG